ncbi:unnamed protein product [Parnassius apollo]|uniref:(apollo) hypothetical protein n=1 Tax=Parnassius apollo TaxID=110799 RepID=A0A8S3XKA8_PARAO|nr:unnamed protein product [Parnassius apollo]
MNHLADLLPKLFPDSQIAKDIRLKRTKVQAVINNCIGETEKENLISDLKSQMFSILIDESTDIAVVKTVAVVVRNYVNSAPIETIDPMTEINHKDLKDIYLGLGVQKELDSVENEERKLTLRKMCKNFIIRACVGLCKRYCFNDKIMTEIAKFDLEKVISDDREESVSSLFPLLPRIAPTSIQHQQELDDEWRKLPLYYKDLDLSQPPDVFWHQVSFHVNSKQREFILVSIVIAA